jgi:hypothetical protein
MGNKAPRIPPAALIIMSGDLKIVWAALCAMVLDVHAPQDNLTADEWEQAERLFAEIDARVNAEASQTGEVH